MDLDKCVHCAQAGVNHKNVPAQQISKVTSNTLAVHPAAATPFCSV